VGVTNRIRGSVDQIPENSELIQVIRRVNEQNAYLWDKATRLEEDVEELKITNIKLNQLIRKVQQAS